jgi:mono/diheme cytochrome c family protein
VTARRENDWLTQWILAPDRMLAEKNPIAIELLAQYNNLPMPNLGLTEPEVAAIIAYLDTQGWATAGTEPASAPVPASPKGDPAIGKNLFTGADRFRSGMAPCIACHSIAGIGALGGGTLGPDLTQSFTKYGGDDGMAAILANIPFPTMKAVFGDDLVLTPEEQADMRAFLEQASVAERPAETVWQLALLAAGGTVILLVVAHLVWRRRLGKVRRPMLTR